MGTYTKKVTKQVVEIDGVKIACTKSIGRTPTYSDANYPSFIRAYENKVAHGEELAKEHAENGVLYMMEGNKSTLKSMLDEKSMDYNGYRCPVIALSGSVIEYAFDQRVIGYIERDGDKLTFVSANGAH